MEVCSLLKWKSSIKHNYTAIFSKKSKNQDSTVCEAPNQLIRASCYCTNSISNTKVATPKQPDALF